MKNSFIKFIISKEHILIVICFLFSLISNSISAQKQNEKDISIEVENVSLKSVFQIIEDKTDYSFMYSSDIINTDKKVTISIKNATIDQVLTEIFKNTITVYSIQGNTITLNNSKEKKQPIE